MSEAVAAAARLAHGFAARAAIMIRSRYVFPVDDFADLRKRNSSD